MAAQQLLQHLQIPPPALLWPHQAFPSIHPHSRSLPNDNFHFCCLIIISAIKIRKLSESEAREKAKIIFNSIDNQQKQENEEKNCYERRGFLVPNSKFNLQKKAQKLLGNESRKQRKHENVWNGTESWWMSQKLSKICPITSGFSTSPTHTPPVTRKSAKTSYFCRVFLPVHPRKKIILPTSGNKFWRFSMKENGERKK